MFVLKPWVRAARERDVVVLLDLRRDRYFALPAAAAPAIAGIEGGGDGSASARLIALQLATAAPVCGSPPNDSADLTPGAALNLSELAALWRACVAASVWLALKRLDWLFNSLRRAKEGLEQGARAPRADIGDDIARFERFRPWFPRRRVCLFDALALQFFLLGRGHRCDLVFGVRASPFAAHAWVESNGVVCSDVLETCLAYTPIARA